MNIIVIIHKAEKGGYRAEVPALKGCYSHGETLKETKTNIREVIEGYLETVQGNAVITGPDDEIFELSA